MSFIIKWSDKAKTSFNENIDYLREDWNEQVLIDFLDRVDEVLNKIEYDPLLYPLYKHIQNIHKCVVSGQITLYYQISDEKNIDLIVFWNVYQNPKKLKL